MADFGGLAQAIMGARPDDHASLSTLQEELKTAAETCLSSGGDMDVSCPGCQRVWCCGSCITLNPIQLAADPDCAEQLIRCVLDQFHRAGAARREVLDLILLEVLPHLAPLATLSTGCAEALADFYESAAEACSPRDMVTASLEVLDQLLSTRANTPALQFLCSFLELLPQLLIRLSRRKAAFITECLVPISKLARVQGELLQGWLLVQLRLAADSSGSQPLHEMQNPCEDSLRYVDTFLAASWQLFEKFTRDVLLEVLPMEADPDAQQCCKLAIGSHILQLLHHLTAAWPPPALTPLALQLLPATAVSAPAAQLPTAASVLLPTPLLSLVTGKQGMRPADGQQQVPEQLSAAADHSDAADVVRGLLTLLKVCGLSSWQALTETDGGAEAAGAALAALYSGYLCEGYPGAECSYETCSRVDMLKMACSWSLTLFEGSQGNPLVVLKAIALVQSAAAQAATMSDAWSTAAAAANISNQPAADSGQKSTATDAARHLLLELEPCVGVLASSMASSSAVLRSQATLAMHQLLTAAGPLVSYCCFKEWLSATGEKQVHPELASLLMQGVRMQLATVQQGCDSPFAGWGSVQLVLPWLQQGGASGWQDTEQLADRANAICAALAVVRLSLLRAKATQTLPAAEALVADSTSLSQTKAELQRVLTPLSAAVPVTLNSLRLLNSVEQGLQQQPSSSSSTDQADIPGEAHGGGQAVDAWLAVSRVQDVLDRVLELLIPTHALPLGTTKIL